MINMYFLLVLRLNETYLVEYTQKLTLNKKMKR